MAEPTVAGLTDILRNVNAAAVIHTAAAGVEPGKNDPDELIAGNVLFTANLVRAAAAVGVTRFVHTGSCFEYGEGPTGVPILETAPLEPASVYGATKLAAAHVARTLAKSLGLPLVIVRLFGVYGPGEASYRLVPLLLDHLANGRPLDLTAGGQVRDLLHVADAAAGLVRAAECDELRTDGTAYNLCSAVPVSVREVGTTAAELLGGERELLRWGAKPYRPDEWMWLVGDNTRFRTATGWTPRFDLRTGLADAIGRRELASRAA